VDAPQHIAGALGSLTMKRHCASPAEIKATACCGRGA